MPITSRITGLNRRFLNPVMLRLVGHWSLVDLEHVGRRTGTVRHTPLMAFRQGDMVTIALTYGPGVEWLRNIRAAGRCRMLLRDEVLTLGPPRTVAAADALARIPQPQRAVLRWPVRCRDFVELEVLPAAAPPESGPVGMPGGSAR